MNIILKKTPYIDLRYHNSFLNSSIFQCNNLILNFIRDRGLMPLSTIFQLYHGGEFFCLGNPENLQKTKENTTTNWNKLLSNKSCIEYTLSREGIELTHFSGDRHWLHRYILIITTTSHGRRQSMMDPSFFKFRLDLWFEKQNNLQSLIISIYTELNCWSGNRLLCN